MNDEVRKEADRHFEAALEKAGARDPRDFYRKALRELRTENADGYDRAVTHFQEVLLPSIAKGEAEPLWAWREYGRLIAEVTAKGRTVAIEGDGISKPFDPEMPLDLLVLHLPEAKGTRAILVSLPPKLSHAQRAAYELLVVGKHKLAGVD
jgi:hypothetical protein